MPFRRKVMIKSRTDNLLPRWLRFIKVSRYRHSGTVVGTGLFNKHVHEDKLK